MELYNYKAVVKSVYDGDTVTADIDLGFYMIQKKVKIRLYGINTPELRGGTDETRKAGYHARDFLRQRVLNQEVVLFCKGKGKYGRWLCEIFVKDGEELVSMNEALITKGLAERYLV